MQVNLENNKYTLTFDEAKGTLVAARYGEFWMDYSGNKFVYLLLARIVELEAELALAKEDIYDVRGHLLHED